MWPGINNDVYKWAKTCLECQRSQVQRHTVTPPGTFTTPDTRFDNVHINIVGPLPASKGYGYLLTCIDRFTHWPEAIPVIDSSFTSFHDQDILIWNSINCHDQSWETIQAFTVEQFNATSGLYTHTYNYLLFCYEWNHRAFPLSAQIKFTIIL